MDLLVIIIALATLFVCVPPAITAMQDLGWLKTFQADTKAPQSPAMNVDMPTRGDFDRVLLTLKPERAEIPGTIEHELMTFEARLPASYRSEDALNGLNNLVRNPRLIRTIANSKAGVSKAGLIFVLVLGGIMGAIIAYSHVDAALYVIVIATGAAIVLFSIFLYLERRKALKALAIVNEYIDYLYANEIQIGVELTQSRMLYDRHDATSVAA